MRKSLTIIFLCLCIESHAQGIYSDVVEDTAINNFMTWLWKSDTAFKETRYVDFRMVRMPNGYFVYPDTSMGNMELYPRNIFINGKYITKYLGKEDGTWFGDQIRYQRMSAWVMKMKGIKIIGEYRPVEEERGNHVLYSYSCPLFSVNKKYVVIIQAFFCGLVCGGGEYSLFERQKDNTWKKIEVFNQWAE